MKIDLTKNGFDSVFTPWQQACITLLTSNRFPSWTSAQLHMGLEEMLMENNVSRASVIGFMKELEVWSIVTVTKDSKQGGDYRIYHPNYTKEELGNHLASLAENWAKAMRNLSSTKTVTKEVS